MNPAKVDFLQNKKNTIFNPVKKYFSKIKQEETDIAKSIKELEKKKKILERDNITLEIEVNNIVDIIKIIDEEYENGVIFKEEIIKIIDEATKKQDQTKAKYYNQAVLEPIEKKLFDLKQMSLVKKQSGIALEVIRNNNKEIIRNIERITDVTFVALNTAIIVAEALYNQKISLKKITELEKGTEKFMQNVGKAVKEEYSINNGSVEDLKKAFYDAYSVIDDVQLQNKKVLPENELKLMELKNKKKEL